MINCILDFDPGVDDAAALFVAKAEKEINLLALSSVSGNVSIEDTTQNMIYLADLLELDVLLGRGQDKALIRDNYFASVHGDDGISGFRDMIKTDNPRKLSSQNSVQMMHDIISNSKDKITIIAVGPLTNIALLLKTFPEDKEKIDKLSIMGGSITVGNVTSLSEFNFFVDPEAAKIVFESGLDIIMAGLNVTNYANISNAQLDYLKQVKTKKTEFAHNILSHYVANDTGIHDPCAVMVLTHPDIFELEDMYIRIDTQGDETRGMSYRDLKKERQNEFNCKVMTKINLEKFSEVLMQALILK